MKNHVFILMLIFIFLLTLNVSIAHELDNTTVLNADNITSEIISTNNSDNKLQYADNLLKTHIEIESNNTFDVIGDYFKVKLYDENNKSISNAQITFAINGNTYKYITDNNGISSLKLRLDDGSYKITTKFSGNSEYSSCSKTATITMNNTRIVGSGLSSFEIQKIIDDAKINNVILFTGKLYENINIMINKSLTLITTSDTVLKSSSTNPVILITGKNSSLTTIAGFYIQGNGNGIVVNDSNYVSIIDNIVKTKSNGILASNVCYLNVTKNIISQNGKNGIVIALANHTYVISNVITNNAVDGIELSKSKNTYIYSNNISNNGYDGIYMSDKVDDVNYGGGPENVNIYKNTIGGNAGEGISIYKAGDNIKIGANTISSNIGNGLSITHVGSNTIQSNVILNNMQNGIKFTDEYVKPANQDISYNVIYGSNHREVEAKETYYSEVGQRLDIGDNWYSDYNTLCPKIKTNNLKFVVTQVGPNQFQAAFYDSKGDIASLLPDRLLSYTSDNGKTVSTTISGGIAVFNVNANDGDIINAIVDRAQRSNVYDSNIKVSSNPINGKSLTYTYPNIPHYQLYEDIGKVIGNGQGGGNGDGTGEGLEGLADKGGGNSSKESSEFTGNSTTSQHMDPNNNLANQINDAQSYETEVTVSQASASESSGADAVSDGSSGNSVVKQISIDEDDIVKITGISFIILLIILTIGLYYREDIEEMKSKM